MTSSGANLSYTWVAPPNAIIQGINGPFLITDAVGAYTVHVMNTTNGCASTMVYHVDYCTGLTEEGTLAGITLYPNPTAGEFIVTASSRTLKMDLQVFDAVGKLLLSKKVAAGEVIDLRDFSRGMYFVKIESGRNTKVIRVIKD